MVVDWTDELKVPNKDTGMISFEFHLVSLLLTLNILNRFTWQFDCHFKTWNCLLNRRDPAGIYLFKFSNGNTRNLTIKTPEHTITSFWCLYS